MSTSSLLLTISQSGQRPISYKTRKQRLWQMPCWEAYSAGLGCLTHCTVTRGEILSPRYSLPCAAAWAYKRHAPPRYVLKVTGSWRGFTVLTSEHQRDWDEHLPLVLMACRSAVQESTTCSPALLMLGRELRTPAELAFGRPPDAL